MHEAVRGFQIVHEALLDALGFRLSVELEVAGQPLLIIVVNGCR